MDKNTVILDVDTYNELRDYKQNHHNNKIYTLISDRSGNRYAFFTKDESLEILNKNLEKSEKLVQEYFDKIQELSRENTILKDKQPIPKIVGIEDIKKMSIWEFKKWRKSNV